MQRCGSDSALLLVLLVLALLLLKRGTAAEKNRYAFIVWCGVVGVLIGVCVGFRPLIPSLC